MMAFDFSVKEKAVTMPCRETESGPSEQRASPGTVNGRQSHNKPMKTFTAASLANKPFTLMREKTIKASGKQNATAVMATELLKATIAEKATAATILTLGSRL